MARYEVTWTTAGVIDALSAVQQTTVDTAYGVFHGGLSKYETAKRCIAMRTELKPENIALINMRELDTE